MSRVPYRWLALLAVAHALGVLVTSKTGLIPARHWLSIAWLWLIWPPILWLHPARSLSRVLVPTAIGLALLVPCMFEIYAFTTWTIRGFAP